MHRLSSFVATVGRTIVTPIARLAGDLLGLVPALLAGAGVFLVVAGLFSYLQPAAAQPLATPTAATATGSSILYSLPPPVSFAPSGSATISESIATRVVIPALGIDLPVVGSPPNEQFPLCNAAEYLTLDRVFAYPGLPRVTYLYAHARKNMFLPLLTQSLVGNGSAMLGMWVEVYTDDNQRHVYVISEVVRHVPDEASSLDRPLGAATDELWLQTSEGPSESSTKLQVMGLPIGVVAATQADAHPTGKGNVCPDAPRCKTSNAGGCRP